MDTQPPELPPGHVVFDPVLTGVDDALAEAERQVGAVLKSVRRQRRAAQEGDISGQHGGVADAADSTACAVAPLPSTAAAARRYGQAPKSTCQRPVAMAPGRS
ncbi:MAG: hypothetical protein HIU82_11820 [Proteobacteria bacterium]|nr:hypothetical protein [Pseudomonadota bacterium]